MATRRKLRLRGFIFLRLFILHLLITVAVWLYNCVLQGLTAIEYQT